MVFHTVLLHITFQLVRARAPVRNSCNMKNENVCLKDRTYTADLMKKWCALQETIASMINVAKNASAVYDALVEMGYDDGVIPRWIARPSDIEERARGKTSEDVGACQLMSELWVRRR